MAITEDGLTYDHELTHGSERTQKDDVPAWLVKLILAIAVATIVAAIFAYTFQACWRATHS